MTDGRRDERLPVEIRVRFKSANLGAFVEEYSKDLSENGLFLRTENPQPVGTLISFELNLSETTPAVCGVGRVVWTRMAVAADASHPAGMGIKFVRLDAEGAVVFDQAKRLVGARLSGGLVGLSPSPAQPEVVAMNSADDADAVGATGKTQNGASSSSDAIPAAPKTPALESMLRGVASEPYGETSTATQPSSAPPRGVFSQPAEEALAGAATVVSAPLGDELSDSVVTQIRRPSGSGRPAIADHTVQKALDAEPTARVDLKEVLKREQGLRSEPEATQAAEALMRKAVSLKPLDEQPTARFVPGTAPSSAVPQPVDTAQEVAEETKPAASVEAEPALPPAPPAIELPPVALAKSRSPVWLPATLTFLLGGSLAWVLFGPSRGTEEVSPAAPLAAAPTAEAAVPEAAKPLPPEAAADVAEEMALAETPAEEGLELSAQPYQPALLAVGEDVPRQPLRITTRPAGVEVRIEGVSQGKSPLRVDLPAGIELLLELEMPGYVPVSQRVHIGESSALALSFNLVPITYVLSLRSDPTGATFVVAGQTVEAPAEVKLRRLARPVVVHARLAHHHKFRTVVEPSAFAVEGATATYILDVKLNARSYEKPGWPRPELHASPPARRRAAEARTGAPEAAPATLESEPAAAAEEAAPELEAAPEEAAAPNAPASATTADTE